ncbi:hypothetical protein M9H77_04136 [Catharanthus roseus]|uniref:Uncharacterized protein n=1 Tax=Catharanthus roseus TaxID=4058 RepID=A0ACC0CDM5_CATRO|nr:hypothetical protein M9H77_04136 [Catharanthus roseus]
MRKRCVWDPTFSMTKMRQSWEIMVGNQIRDLLGDARTVRKRPQADLIERFSKSRHLEELYKYQTGDKKGQYVDTFSEEFSVTAATGAPMPNDLQLMATIFGGLSHDRLYGAGSEAAHLRAESSQAEARLPPCCLEAEYRIMR